MRSLITLRPTCADDEAFLYRLFCCAQDDQFASLDLPANQKDQLMQLQFQAKQQQYRSQYPDADFDLILDDEEPIGNLYALRGPKSYVLIDITLLPERRNAGIGTALVGALVSNALAAEQTLRAHVLKQNPAWRLWQRMGFGLMDDDGIYLSIEVPATTTCKD
jgi:GNAT superfamily N-acetyltransferase